MSAPPATIGPSAYWYFTRSTGWVSLLLLTAAVVLGVIQVNRWSSPGWPRLVVHGLHRYVSLLVLVFLAAHILTAVLDGFTAIGLVDSIVPFVGSYRPIWLGLGAVAFDLLLAVAITSLARRRVGYRAWRLVHWLSYACWPVALVHSLGTGSDVKSMWSAALTALCVLAVAVAVGVRAVRGWPGGAPVRAASLAVTALGLVALILWLPGGPLGHSWARRAGTPPSLLATTSAASFSQSTSRQRQREPEPFAGGFTASASGTIEEGPGPGPGQIAVRLATSFTAGAVGTLDIEIDGSPLPRGGVALRNSSVSLGSPQLKSGYRGRIIATDAGRLLASVSDGSGHRLSLRVNLSASSEAGAVTGTVSAIPVSNSN